jgi:hypothetical protein
MHRPFVSARQALACTQSGLAALCTLFPEEGKSNRGTDAVFRAFSATGNKIETTPEPANTDAASHHSSRRMSAPYARRADSGA